MILSVDDLSVDHLPVDDLSVDHLPVDDLSDVWWIVTVSSLSHELTRAVWGWYFTVALS